MFDRTYVLPHRTEYVPYEKTTIEKRAPTDDSIRIYEEIKGKAYKSILDTIEINDNSFNVKAIVYDEMLTMERVCKFSFTLNGREISDEVRERSTGEYSKEDLIRAVIKKAADKLSLELVKILAR
jgi:hypothetical protein